MLQCVPTSVGACFVFVSRLKSINACFYTYICRGMFTGSLNVMLKSMDEADKFEVAMGTIDETVIKRKAVMIIKHTEVLLIQSNGIYIYICDLIILIRWR